MFMRRDASLADARSLVGIAKPDFLVDSGEPVEVPGLLLFSGGRDVFRVASGDGGLLILSLRGVRGSRGCFLMSTDMTLRIIPS
jgi:hypothetical protein